jgi:hypothetical protein
MDSNDVGMYQDVTYVRHASRASFTCIKASTMLTKSMPDADGGEEENNREHTHSSLARQAASTFSEPMGVFKRRSTHSTHVSFGQAL